MAIYGRRNFMEGCLWLSVKIKKSATAIKNRPQRRAMVKRAQDSAGTNDAAFAVDGSAFFGKPFVAGRDGLASGEFGFVIRRFTCCLVVLCEKFAACRRFFALAVGGEEEGGFVFHRFARPGVTARPFATLDILDTHAHAGLRGVQHASAAEVEADVIDNAFFAEENEIAGLRLAGGLQAGKLFAAVTRNIHAFLMIEVMDKAGAVEAFGSRAAPQIGGADVFLAFQQDGVAGLGVTTERCRFGFAGFVHFGQGCMCFFALVGRFIVFGDGLLLFRFGLCSGFCPASKPYTVKAPPGQSGKAI